MILELLDSIVNVLKEYPVALFIVGYAVFLALVVAFMNNSYSEYDKEIQIELDKLTIKKGK